jgi:hypothetical protein
MVAACTFSVQAAFLCAEEGGTLLKGGVSMDASLDSGTQSMLDAEDSRHEGKMSALDSKEQGLEDAHESEMKAIDEQENLKGDAKERAKKEKTRSHERKMKDLERERATEERVHQKRVGEIMKKGKKLLSDAASSASRSAQRPPDRWSDESVPGRMMKLAAEMDRVTTEIQGNAMTAGNKFFGKMSESISKGAQFMAQDPEVPLGQMIDGLVTYLNNDHNENDQMLYDAAVKAVEDMQNDPATFFGEHAVDIALSGAGAAAEIAGARAVGTAGEIGAVGKGLPTSPPVSPITPPKRPSYTPSPPLRPSPPPPSRPSYTPPSRTSPPPPRPAYTPPSRPTPPPPSRATPPPPRPTQTPPPPRRPTPQIQREQRAQALEKAGQTLKGMAENAQKFSTFDLKAGSAAPDFSKIFPKSPSTTKGPVNIARSIDPNAGTNNCFPVSLAAAKRWKTGRPYVALDHNPHMPLYDPALNKFVYEDVMADSHSIVKALRENFGKGKAKDPFHDGPEGLKSHQEGIPVPSNQRDIETAVFAGGEKSQGLVFVDAGEGTPGHVFNVRRNGDQIEFWDFQEDPPIRYLKFDENEVVMSRDGVTAAINLDWKRVFYYRLE